MLHDAIIIGGSYAGMAAALQLARARRHVLVIDAGQRRNRFAAHSHGFLTQDGEPPGAIAERARAQLLAYPSVAWREGKAVAAAQPVPGRFAVALEDGALHEARRLVLATGVTDLLPELPGLAERWGRSVFLCPYCDGYELAQGPLGVLASSPSWFHQAMLIPEWGPTTLFLQDQAADEAQRAALAARGVRIEPRRVLAVTGARAAMQLEDGESIALAGLFLQPRIAFASPVAESLGCAMEEGPMGRYLRTDPRRATSIPGVFAAGDVARGAGSVSLAVGDGAMAGAALHQSLVFGLG
ncbi:NAD(P)/FAD-dependent oxidoreductase [Pseudoroseomonas cervicalis]|uniref:NAD(P)/FAD-dependent oxidoreductase n=1 Tax=Teichococcus cervicalis TaxID=204525 RepID=UPI0022F1D131|nr:NAD(P)/FAD-dependent oxidoreductase [Pseudoroseomonas cervicalis]WBV41407.1 NAD(P)/FAD-dependent oxidoreductase [Pseudoroseomonas cervicalis]